MNIQKLKLTNFRKHRSAEFIFSGGTNLIIGPNGAGKTNILEAVNLLSTGKSFRARYDYEMIFNPQVLDIHDTSVITKDIASYREYAKVTGYLDDGNDKETLEISLVKNDPYTRVSKKTFKVNGSPKPISDSLLYLSTVLFCPQDLELFNGSPSARRDFLDQLLGKIDQRYKREHAVYSKAVKHRNRILEKINKTGFGENELVFWTDKILESGAILQEKRSELLDLLNSKIELLFCDISAKKTKVVIDYKINPITRSRLDKHHEHEIYAKTTLVGPHRDDFDFLINNFNIGHYGSRGQQRTGVLSLKICELDVVKQKNILPILLLDDIFSELDDTHKKSLEYITKRQQTLITSTHKEIETDNTITL